MTSKKLDGLKKKKLSFHPSEIQSKLLHCCLQVRETGKGDMVYQSRDWPPLGTTLGTSAGKKNLNSNYELPRLSVDRSESWKLQRYPIIREPPTLLWVLLPGVLPDSCSKYQRKFPSCFQLGEGKIDGNLLQYSCLENPIDRGTWWAAIYGVTQIRTQLKWLSSSSSTFY